MPRTWYVVRTTDYYGEYDEVGDLHAGELVFVKWPDKSITKEKLRALNSHGSAQVDMNGIPDRFPTRRLYVTTKHHGVTVRIYLRGLAVARV